MQTISPHKPITTLISLSLLITLFLAIPIPLAANQSAATTANSASACSDLFISEYIEGSSYNKVIEIYNGTDAAVDLSAYKIELHSNTTTIRSDDLAGTLAVGDVFVVAHARAHADVLAVADMTNSSVINFNGDDAFALKKADTIIDVIGQIGTLPDDSWGTGTVTTKDDTLRRKSSITAGDSDGSDAFDPATEWDGFAKDSFDGLGSHTADGCGEVAATTALLLTEIVVTPTDGEFIEIYNPGSASVDLSNIYLTDATFARGSVYYYNIVTGADAGGGGFGDFHARFPDGAAIGAGEYQTVALSGSTKFKATYAVDPTYELFEDDDSADTIPDMREATAGSINNQGGLTNSGEVVVLYEWDGASDLVADHDYFVYGDTAEAVDKTDIAIDGPDADTDDSTYLDDTVLTSQKVYVDSHAEDEAYQRKDLTEGEEIATGGNGITGHNEMSENLPETWCTSVKVTPNAASDCSPPTTEPYVPVNIYDIQGSGDTSTLVDDLVETTGIVTADYQAGGFGGFVIQDPDGDSDPLTSDGIFVYTGDSPITVTIGDPVTVAGTVGETFGVTQLSDVTVTENPTGAGSIAPAKITLPVASVATLEQYEGMVVEFDQTLHVTENYNLGRYGQLLLSAEDRLYQFTHTNAPDAAGYATHLDTVARSSILLDDGLTSQNDDPTLYPSGGLSASNSIRSGDTVANLTGIMHYAFGDYMLEPIAASLPTFTSTNPRPAASLETPDDQIAVASLNALNFFTTIDPGGDTGCGPDGTSGCRGADSSAEFDRQLDKLIKALVGMDADVIGLMEVENLNSNVAAADDTQLQSLVAGINATAEEGTTFAFIETGTIGTDAIRVAILYNTETVTPVGDFKILDSSVDTTFNDGKNRPALAQTFKENLNDGEFTVAVNHFKSKGSNCSDTGIDGDDDTTTGQGNCNGTRTAAANALKTWLAGDPTGSGDSDILIIGDLNAYRMEDPIMALKSAGYVDLAESVTVRAGTHPYSYVFGGQWGYLDYALGSPSLSLQVVSVEEWHINADEPRALDYNEEFNAPGFYADDVYRVSDHDPIIVRLRLSSTSAVTLSNTAAPTVSAQEPVYLFAVMLLICTSVVIVRRRDLG